jgi:dimethylargininase
MGTNVLALANDNVVMLEGNIVTAHALTAAGVHVHFYKGDEISLKAEGGATCLVRPILRT